MPVDWPARNIARYPKKLKIPSRFFEKRFVRSPTRINPFRSVVSRATWYAEPSKMAKPANDGMYWKADWNRAMKGGRNPSVKKKFQCTPYSVTCSA